MKLNDDINIEPIYAALSNDKYNSGTADYTPSSLNQPAYQRRLQQDYEGTENASDRIFALLGTATHHVIELAAENMPNYISERRYYGSIATDYGDKSVGAQIDLYDTEALALYDMKVTSAYSVAGGKPKDDWVAQLNVGRWCIFQDTHECVESMTIVAILRDWSKMKAKTDRFYPQKQVVKVKIPVWTLEQTEAWIRGRINTIEKYLSQPIKECTPCSDEEVWARPNKFAVMKKGLKRATKLHDTLEDAKAHAATDSKFFVENRPGERIRCSNYCSMSEFCKFSA